MKPSELRPEMRPGRIEAPPLLEIREMPAIIDLCAIVRHGSTLLWKARMGEHEYCHPVHFQDTVEGVQKVYPEFDTHTIIQVRLFLDGEIILVEW
jgi:hypothetical protein